MAHIATPEVRATNEVHEGVGPGIEVACQESFIGNLKCCLEGNGCKGFPTVVLFKGLRIIDWEGRGPIKEHSLPESPH